MPFSILEKQILLETKTLSERKINLIDIKNLQFRFFN